jgi:hypothetical protein
MYSIRLSLFVSLIQNDLENFSRRYKEEHINQLYETKTEKEWLELFLSERYGREIKI